MQLVGKRVVLVTNSTFRATRQPDRGGGFYNSDGPAVIRFSTITANAAAIGQAAGSRRTRAGSTRTEVQSSIVAGNVHSDADFVNGAANTFQSSGYNLIGTGNAIGKFINPGDQTGVADPLLGPLADNGGPTLSRTRSCRAARRSMRAISMRWRAWAACRSLISGASRLVACLAGRIDIGAFEYQTPTDLNLLVDTLVDESDGDYCGGRPLAARGDRAGEHVSRRLDTIRFASGPTAAARPRFS